jgi:hypothetical protein
MSEKWIQDCKKILQKIRKIGESKGKDRLDVVRAMRFTLFALQRSVTGWIDWVNNPDIMATFSLEELNEINKNLSELIRPFIEYDAKVTGNSQKTLIRPEANEDCKEELIQKPEKKSDVFYVR